jgi:hypothetical protein
MVAGEGLFAASGSPCGPRCARCLTAFDPNLQSKLLILLQVLLTGFIDWLEEDCSMKWWREKDYSPQAAHPAGRAARVVSLRSTRTFGRSFSSFSGCYLLVFLSAGGDVQHEMVAGEGFEPSKSMTADLQSAPFGRSGIPPGI